jgi:hypothetical protein
VTFSNFIAAPRLESKGGGYPQIVDKASLEGAVRSAYESDLKQAEGAKPSKIEDGL